MEYVIRNHLKSYGPILAIYPLEMKFSLKRNPTRLAREYVHSYEITFSPKTYFKRSNTIRDGRIKDTLEEIKYYSYRTGRYIWVGETSDNDPWIGNPLIGNSSDDDSSVDDLWDGALSNLDSWITSKRDDRRYKYISNSVNFNVSIRTNFADDEIETILLKTKGYKFEWNGVGELVYESYTSIFGQVREIFYIGQSMVVRFLDVYYIYDFKSFLLNINKDDIHNRLYIAVRALNKYNREELYGIADGDFSLVKNYNIYFHKDKNGVVNATMSANPVKRVLILDVGYTHKKEKEEIEKLRLDPRKYVPNIIYREPHIEERPRGYTMKKFWYKN